MYKRSEKDLLSALREQMGFLRLSNKEYDKGNRAEAKRLATTAYLLLFDGRGRVKSLLGQVCNVDKIKFLSSAICLQPLQSPMVSLAGIYQYLSNTEFNPHCAVAAFPPWVRSISFEEWWTEPIYGETETFGKIERTLSRKDMVSELRSRDGGSHLDGTLNNGAYSRLAFGDGSSLAYNLTDGSAKPMEAPHLATMRQIAHEIEISVLPYFNQLLPFDTKPWPLIDNPHMGVSQDGLKPFMNGDGRLLGPLLPIIFTMEKVGHIEP